MILLDFMDRHLLTQYITVNTRKKSILDLFMTNDPQLVLNNEAVKTMLSDHNQVEIHISKLCSYKAHKVPVKHDAHSFKSLKLNSAKCHEINQQLSQVDWQYLFSLCENEGEFPELFNLTLLQICMEYTPVKPEFCNQNKSRSKELCIICRKKQKLLKKINLIQNVPGSELKVQKLQDQISLLKDQIIRQLDKDLEYK